MGCNIISKASKYAALCPVCATFMCFMTLGGYYISGKKKGKPLQLAFLRTSELLNSYDILSLRAFLALSYIELYQLTFSQCFETRAYDCTKVCKNVWARCLLNKAETFRFVEPFYGTSSCIRHDKYPVNKKIQNAFIRHE